MNTVTLSQEQEKAIALKQHLGDDFFVISENEVAKIFEGTEEEAKTEFEEAKEIGIKFDATDTDQTAVVNQFADSLRGTKKKISMFGFYNFPRPAINFNFPYFNQKSLNWYLEPNGILVKEFIEKKFDILINVSVSENLPLE